jgi:hypothetical protein
MRLPSNANGMPVSGKIKEHPSQERMGGVFFGLRAISPSGMV